MSPPLSLSTPVSWLPISAPDLTGNEERYVAEAVRSGWVSSAGSFIDRFEREFALVCGSPHALACSSGTAALHLAIAALGAGRGDEVIVPATTFAATANAVAYTGATPVFVDVDPVTWCLSPEAAAAAVTKRTRGIIPVHLFGHPADMDAINAIAADHGLWVVEDAAEAPFATYRGRPVGSLADAAAFSFFGNKIVTSGEGGAVTFSDPALGPRLRMLRNHGMNPNRKYDFPIIGFNYRMSNVSAALACAQLERWEYFVARRQAVVQGYEQRLQGIPGLELRQDAAWAGTVPWMFAAQVDRQAFGLGRDELATMLAAWGIETRPVFPALHKMPPYRQFVGRRRLTLPHAERLGETGIMLPTHPLMSEADVVFVCDAVIAASRGRGPVDADVVGQTSAFAVAPR